MLDGSATLGPCDRCAPASLSFPIGATAGTRRDTLALSVEEARALGVEVSSRAFTVGVALAATGCIPLPYVVPPIRGDVATGVQGTTLPGVTSIQAPLELEVGAFPLALIEQLHDRRVDVGLGGLYTLDATGQRLGAFLEGGGVVAGWQWDQRILRLVPEAQLRVVDDPDTGRAGLGAAGRCTFELSTFIPAFTYNDNLDWGAGQGELAIGVYVEASTAQIPHEETYALLFGVTFRLPALAGLSIVPLH